jgi:Mrp family chromosome partitioning ATPase
LCRCEAGFFAHAGEKLRAAVELGLGVLAIASSHRGEGCSTLALCLARSAAKTGVRAALLDADFGNPELAASLGVQASCGWPEVTARRLPLGEAAVGSLDDGLTLLPLMAADRHAPLALDDPLVTAAIRQAAEMFDLLIVDIGSISNERIALFERGDACPVDAAIVVRDVRHTAEEQTLASAGRLQRLGVDAVGIAENFGTGQQPPASQPENTPA